MVKILVIEDDPLVSETLAALLAKAGYAVVTAADGRAGLAAYAAESPDLVITDLIMPEKEGIETIRELRAAAAGLPIIAISGGGRTQNYDFLEFARHLGANEALRKPFAPDELLAALARCLQRTNP